MAACRQSPLHGPAMPSPLCTRGAFSLPRWTQPAKAKKVMGPASRWPRLGREKGRGSPVAGRAQCLGRHTFFAQANTTGKGKESYGSSVTLAPPGARKRSGKNLVFPRDPAAAPADYLQVISALCRNNTPPKLQKIPRRFPPGDFFAAASAAADALDHQISGLASAGRALG